MSPGQHAPHGEMPSGYHPSFWEDAAWRQKRLIAIYWRLVNPGELVFDIGANVGEFTRAFLSISCDVVAVEPQAEVAAHIPEQATVVVKAVGAQPGRRTFFACAASPALSTFSTLVRDCAPPMAAGGFIDREVDVTTMDELIAEHGVPAFAKIDVEGWEPEVLAGLSQPLRALSFEVHNFQPAKAQVCISRLDELGDYSYLYAPGESFELEPWPPKTLAVFGDVYAINRDQPRPQPPGLLGLLPG